MKFKTSELVGNMLDYAVTNARGQRALRTPEGVILCPAYSTDWAVGGPVVESSIVMLAREPNGQWLAEGPQGSARGPSALVASMRAVVAAAFGDTVDLLIIET
jgi:hypothetical protein